MKGFREFLLRGNVVDLAVAVVIGAAFGLVVSAFVKDIVTAADRHPRPCGSFRQRLHGERQRLPLG